VPRRLQEAHPLTLLQPSKARSDLTSCPRVLTRNSLTHRAEDDRLPAAGRTTRNTYHGVPDWHSQEAHHHPRIY